MVDPASGINGSASRAGKVNRLAVREDWRTLHDIAHVVGPTAKEK